MEVNSDLIDLLRALNAEGAEQQLRLPERVDGVLTIGGARVDTLAATYGTPLLAIDLDVVDDRTGDAGRGVRAVRHRGRVCREGAAAVGDHRAHRGARPRGQRLFAR